MKAIQKKKLWNTRFASVLCSLFVAAAPICTSAGLLDSGITIGPYLQRVSTNAATILVRTDEAQQVTLNYRAADASKWKRSTESTTATTHRYRLTSLKRGQSYEYYLTNSSGARLTQTYTFTTQRTITNANPLRVAVLGDSGVANTTQYEVASEMAAWQPELLLHTGDIAYDSGTEQEFIDKFFVVYSSMLSEMPFYGSIGNHDHTTDSAAPYKDLFETPKNSGTEDYYSFNYDNTHFVSLNSNLDYSVGSDMYEWLDADLAATTKKWVIVYFHHPPYSSGEHGSSPELQSILVPLFEEHNVDLVLNGHDHTYERFNTINGVQYIVTGGGGNSLYDLVDELDESALFLSENHFVGLTISNKQLRIQAIDEDGFVFDSVTLK